MRYDNVDICHEYRCTARLFKQEFDTTLVVVFCSNELWSLPLVELEYSKFRCLLKKIFEALLVAASIKHIQPFEKEAGLLLVISVCKFTLTLYPMGCHHPCPSREPTVGLSQAAALHILLFHFELKVQWGAAIHVLYKG